MPSGDVDPQLRVRVVGAVARPGDRLDALGPRVYPHQRVGHPDGGAPVGDGDRKEVGQRAVKPALGIAVDACAVGHGRGEVRVEMFEHHGSLEPDQCGR